MPTTDEKTDAIKLVMDHAPRVFSWRYERDRDRLVTLYDKATASQWNSVTDLDWTIDVDPEQVVHSALQGNLTVELAQAAAQVSGSPFAKWGEKEFTQLGIEELKASLSQFMHGEQGAMLVAAKIVETVPWIDAKYFAATQTMDEARHTEVFAKYLHTKLGGVYPMSPYLEAQIDAIIADSRWDIAYLGMQVIVESLALASFSSMQQATEEPLLKKLLRYVMADEARHVAFGVLSLHEFYQGLSSAELRERQDFLAENTLRSRARSAMPEVWERMGTSLKAVLPSMFRASTTLVRSQFGSFEGGFFAKLVPNVRKLGLLDANDGYLRRLWADAGLLRWEFADDTATDFERYDYVAQDRLAIAPHTTELG